MEKQSLITITIQDTGTDLQKNEHLASLPTAIKEAFLSVAIDNQKAENPLTWAKFVASLDYFIKQAVVSKTSPFNQLSRHDKVLCPALKVQDHKNRYSAISNQAAEVMAGLDHKYPTSGQKFTGSFEIFESVTISDHSIENVVRQYIPIIFAAVPDLKITEELNENVTLAINGSGKIFFLRIAITTR